MEFIAVPSYATSPYLHIVHGEQSVSIFSGLILRPGLSESMPRLLYHLNWFVSQLSQDKQHKLFKIYEAAEKLLRPVPGEEVDKLLVDMPLVNIEVRELLANLIDLLPSAGLLKWISPYDMYPWPSPNELPRTYEQAVSAKYPKEKTYILKEYQELFTLIIQLRAVAPIWSAYLAKYKEQFASDYRDMILVGLLDESEFEQSPAYARLVAYVNAWVNGGKKGTNETGVMHGISSDEYPKWLLCNVLVRKLSFQSLESPQEGDASPFVIKHLSNNIRETMNKSPAQFSDPTRKDIANKDPGGSDDDRGAVYELNRTTQKVGNGERWTIQIYAEDPMRIILALEPEINKPLADAIVSSFNFGEYIPSNEQLLVALYVVYPCISPRAEPDLTRLNAAMVCAAACAVLWHRGHQTVAVFLSSVKGQPITRSGMINPSSILYNKGIYAELEKLYVFADKLRGATITRNVVAEIVLTSEQFQWHPKLKPELIALAKESLVDACPNTTIVGPNDDASLHANRQLGLAIILAVVDMAKRPMRMSAWDKATQMAKQMNLPDHPVPWEPVPVPQRRIL